MHELIMAADFIWLRRPGATGGVRGSEALKKIKGKDPDLLQATAAELGPPLIGQIVEPGKPPGKYFKIEVPEEIEAPPMPPRPHYQHPPPFAAPQGANFELFRLQMEIDRMREQTKNAQNIDIRWLQKEIEELRKENAQIRADALATEREAYQKGKDDAETAAPLGEGFGLKDLAPIFKQMATEKPEPPPEPVPPPEDGPRPMTGADLRELIGLVLAEQLPPKSAPPLIVKMYGRPAFEWIKEKKTEIFSEVATEPELMAMANGKTPELIAALNEEIENYV